MKEDISLRLQCDCHFARCFALFDFMWWTDKELPDEPYLCLNFLYHPGGIFHRIKMAWRVIRENKWQEAADMTIGGMDKVRELRDFLNKCLEQDAEMEEKNR